MKLRTYILLTFCFLFGLNANTLTTWAQKFTQICQIEINDIDQSVVDYSGNIFVSTINGDIRKFNNQCEEQLVFSPMKTGKIKQLNIWSQFKVFAFYEELQEYVVLNRFLTSPVRYSLSNLKVGYVSNATLNFQQNLWLIDESDFMLKLIDLERNEVVTSQQLNQHLDIANHEITNLIESKGRLYLIDNRYGILIYDNFGNYVDKIEAKGVISVSFEKESLIYFIKEGLVEVSLNSLDQRTLEWSKDKYEDLIRKNNTFYGITNNGFEIYEYLRKD